MNKYGNSEFKANPQEPSGRIMTDIDDMNSMKMNDTILFPPWLLEAHHTSIDNLAKFPSTRIPLLQWIVTAHDISFARG